MNKKLTKLLSVFAIAGALSVGVAFGATGCSNNNDDPPSNEQTEYTVTFNMNGHGTNTTAKTSGGKVTKPTDPTATGYTFGGWYKDAACTTEFSFSTAVSADTTLYAKWTEVVMETISVDITQSTAVVKVELTTTLTVTTNDEQGVTWSSSDETKATVSSEGVVTGVAAGTVTITATSKTDSTKKDTAIVSVQASTRFDVISAMSNNIISEDFSTQTEGAELAKFTDWGTAGVYEAFDSGATDEKITVVTGQAKGQNTSDGKNMYLVTDFGAVEGVVEGCVTFGFLATASSGNGNSVQFCNGDTVVLTLVANATAFKIDKLSGAATIPTVTTTCDITKTYLLDYKFDLTNKTVTLKLGDETICTDLPCDIDNLTGFKVATSNKGKRGIVIDDIAVSATVETLATYKTRTTAKVTAMETAVPILASNTTYTDAKTAYTSALEAATDKTAVDTAYNTLYSATLAALGTYATNQVTTFFESGYEHDATAVTAYKTEISTEITAATSVETLYKYITEMLTEEQLTAHSIRPDTYYAKVDVTVVIYEKGTTTSVVKEGTTLTGKSGDTITLEELKAAIVLPTGKLIKTIYTDSAGTTELTTNYVLDAGTSTEAVTTTLYVEFYESVETTYTFDVSAITEYTDNTVLAQTDFTGDNSFITVTGTVKYREGKGCVEIKGDALTVTFKSGGTIKISAASTGNSNNSSICLKDSSGNYIAATYTSGDTTHKDDTNNIYGMYSTTYVEYTFTVTEAGTYTIATASSITENRTSIDTNRNTRIKSIVMTDKV